MSDKWLISAKLQKLRTYNIQLVTFSYLCSMKIGTIDFGERPLFLAPMEDVTDIGFRKMCKRFGAAMVYTEFVSADAVIRSIKSTLNKIVIDEEDAL